MKLSNEEIKTMKSLHFKCVAALELIQGGQQIEVYAKKYADAFTEIGTMLSNAIARNNARVIGDLVVDENGNCSPLNTKS